MERQNDGLLSLRNSFAGTSYCVTLSGELGAASLDSFSAAMLRMEESGAEETAVELSRLDFIDSSGMAALAEIGKRFRTHGGHLRLVGEPKRFANHRRAGEKAVDSSARLSAGPVAPLTPSARE